MSYKNTYFYTCVRVYKYRRKTYINFLNIIQSEPLPDLLTYFTFYVKYIYLWFSARGIHSGLFFGLMETVGFLFLSCFFFVIGFSRSQLCPYEVFGTFNYLRTHCALHYYIYFAMTTLSKSLIRRR